MSKSVQEKRNVRCKLVYQTWKNIEYGARLISMGVDIF